MNKLIFLLASALLLISTVSVAFAQTQSHPLNQITPIFTNFDLNNTNITNLNYLNYSGGILYQGSQGIPTADIAGSAVTGAKIASSVVTASKLSNPLGGSVNGSAYYDSDSSTYYLDPAGTANAFNSAGPIIINTGANSPTASSGQTVISNLGNSLYIGVPASTNLLRGYVGGSEVLRVDSTGGVGVGTTNIGSGFKLNVSGGAVHVHNGGFQLDPGNSISWSGFGRRIMYDSSLGGLRLLYTGDQNGIFIRNTDGYVGVHSTNPQQELEVVGDLNVTGTIYGAINTTGDVNCTQCVDTSDIADSAVTSSKIANGAITSSDLSNPLGGSMNATAYYDSDNSAYYLDPASSGTSFSSAGSIVLNNNEFLYGKNSVNSDSLLIGRNSSDHLQIGDRAFNNPLVVTTGNNFMALETNGIERMRVSAAGLVGIGTASPASKLDIYQSQTGSYLSLTRSDITSENLTVVGVADSGIGTTFSFQTQGWNGAGYDIKNALALRGNGRVGINTTSPSYTLQVSGGDIYLDSRYSKYRVNSDGSGNIGWFASSSNGNGLDIDTGASTYGLNISQGGTPRITLSSDGNIGLTKTPDSNARLNIEFADSTFAVKGSRSGTELFGIHANSWNPVSFQSIGSRDLSLETSQGGNAYIYLQDSSSNIGIGNTTPAGKLHISGTNVDLRLNDGVNDWGLQVIGSRNGEFELRHVATNKLPFVVDTSGNVNIGSSSTGLPLNPPLYVESGGKVGIGTTSPNRKLDIVDGSIQMRHQNGIFWWNSNIDNAGMGFINFSAPAGIGGNLIFGTNGVEVMRIDTDQRVGIGITTPAQKIAVAGSGCVGDSESDCDAQSTTAGNLYAKTRTGGAIDVAEWIKFTGAKPQAGDVVCAAGGSISNGGTVKLCSQSKSRTVLGIVSTKPHMTIGEEYRGEDAIVMAIAGRVPVNVEGNVNAGDILVSGTNGKAIACTENCEGAVIGKAITGAENGKVLALVSVA